MTNVADIVDIDGALGRLINLSGKMRMLSHRAALFAMRVGERGDGSARHLAAFDEAVREFEAIFRAVREGNAELGVPVEAAEALAEDGVLSKTITDPIEAFLALAKSLRAALKEGPASPDTTDQFVDLVAGELLSALNRLTAAVSASLNTRMTSRQASTEEARAAMLKAVGSISDVSMKVKLISINASIEAARAGPYGKSFGVIASEIRTLSEDAARSAQGLRDQMEHSA
jgi:methyl-accepting chemotaxis protein